MVPTLYLINATSLAKTHAIQLLASDLQQFRVDVGCVTESWFNDNNTRSSADAEKPARQDVLCVNRVSAYLVPFSR